MPRWVTRRLAMVLTGAWVLTNPVVAASTVGAPLPGVFRQTDLDGGGWLTGFAAHASGRLYARTDVGGAYRSDDRGATWSFISGDLTSPAAHCVQGLVVGETSADLVFQAVGVSHLGTDPGRGVWRSADGGRTWGQVLTGVNFSGNDDLRWEGECLAITPGSGDQEVWAISRQHGLWRSVSGGGSGSWTKQAGATFDGLIGHVVHLHAAFPNDVFVGGVKSSAASALFKGTRGAGGAVAWLPVTISAGTTAVGRLARLPSGVMFAAVQEGSANRFYKSDATGTTWTQITSALPGSGSANGPIGMCHVLADGQTVVLGWIGGPTVRSTNGGATWTTVPLTIAGDRPLAMLTSDGAIGWSRGSITQDPLDPNRWYIPNGFGPFLSTNAGATASYMTRGIGEVVSWKPAFHPTDPSRVYLPVADLIGFVVTDGGVTGAAQRNPRRSLPVTNGNVGMTYATKVLVGPAVAGVPPKLYFVGGAFFGDNANRGCVLATSDEGQSWSLVHVSGKTGTGLPAFCDIVSGCVAPDDGNDLVLSVFDRSGAASGFYRSTNGGVAFTKSSGVPAAAQVGDEFSHFSGFETDRSTPNRRFAWANGAGFLISNDRGATWTSAGHASNGPATQKLYDWNTWGSLCRDGVTGRLWFGGLDGHLGLAHSDTHGLNWTYLDTPFSNTGFAEVVGVDAHDHQIVVIGRRFGDTFRKIYYSENDGVHWRECTKPDYRFPTATDVALDPHRRGTFWVGTSGRSFARFTPGPFGAWQQSRFNPFELNVADFSGADADPDGDGPANVAEYAFGLNPHQPEATHPVLPSLSAGDSSFPELSFGRQSGVTDLDYLIRTSADLSSWQMSAIFSGPTPLPSAFANGVSLIEDPVTHRVRFRTDAGDSRLFYRVDFGWK